MAEATKKKKHLVPSPNDEKTRNPNCSEGQHWACRESKSSAREKETSCDEERISAAQRSQQGFWVVLESR